MCHIPVSLFDDLLSHLRRNDWMWVVWGVLVGTISVIEKALDDFLATFFIDVSHCVMLRCG